MCQNFGPNGKQEAAKNATNCHVVIDITYLNTVFLCNVWSPTTAIWTSGRIRLIVLIIFRKSDENVGMRIQGNGDKKKKEKDKDKDEGPVQQEAATPAVSQAKDGISKALQVFVEIVLSSERIPTGKIENPNETTFCLKFGKWDFVNGARHPTVLGKTTGSIVRGAFDIVELADDFARVATGTAAKAEILAGSEAVDIAAETAGQTAVAATKSSSSVLRVLGFVTGGLGIAVDIGMIALSGRSLAKGSKTGLASTLDRLADFVEKEEKAIEKLHDDFTAGYFST